MSARFVSATCAACGPVSMDVDYILIDTDTNVACSDCPECCRPWHRQLTDDEVVALYASVWKVSHPLGEDALRADAAALLAVADRVEAGEVDEATRMKLWLTLSSVQRVYNLLGEAADVR